MFKHILVPTDGSALSEGTVSRAVTFAREASARITFFYSQPDFPMPIYGEGALIDPTTPEQFAKSVGKLGKIVLAAANSNLKTRRAPKPEVREQAATDPKDTVRLRRDPQTGAYRPH